MSDTSGGSGAAHEATVLTVNDVVELEAAAVAKVSHDAAIATADAEIAAGEAKVEKQKAHLEAAQQGLAEARAARKELD